jgi:ammonia channel protein AmtB
MEIIWLAILLYSVGLAIVLYLRPAIMFHENGTWKEFGYKRDSRHTIFPFWLFSIVWALVAYALAASVKWYYFGTLALVSEPESWSSSWSDSESDQETEPEPEMVKVSELRKKPRPGYYVLNAGSKKGIRKYVYYGQEPPT